MSTDTALPGFADDRAELDGYAVERESRPHHDTDRIRIRDEMAARSTLMILVLVRAANADGWRLDEHTDHGEELTFVPFEGGGSR